MQKHLFLIGCVVVDAEILDALILLEQLKLQAPTMLGEE